MEYNILVVEDENGIRETISIFLENQGYHIFTAENGAQGLEIIHNNDIHLAVVDIMMPVMDGMTMVLKLREKYDMPVIFLSAKSEDIDKIKGLNVGADDYITKPFEPLELIARVNSNLRRNTTRNFTSRWLNIRQRYKTSNHPWSRITFNFKRVSNIRIVNESTW